MKEDRWFQTAGEVQGKYGIDLATAETMRASLIATTRHMKDRLIRSAFSNVVRELLDFGCSIHLVEPEGTEMFAITEGCTHFAFTHQHGVNMVMREWGIDNLGPGDTLFCNDSWRGSIHFPDVNLYRPVFWEGKPVFILADTAHVVDIGGPVPGGFNNLAETFFEEGLRVPPTLIVSGDIPVRSTINLLLENSRAPLHVLGDLRALFGTLKVGEELLLELLNRHGYDKIKATAHYMLDLSERRMRRALVNAPDGEWSGEEWLDDDGSGGDPVAIRITLRKKGESAEIDFSGTDRQPLHATTTCWEETIRCLLGAKTVLDPRHPINAGMFRPFHVIAPPGSAVMGLPPTSQSQHPEIAAKMTSLMIHLFGQMVPSSAMATDSAATHVYGTGGIDDRPGRNNAPFGVLIDPGAAWGGSATNDGISFNSSPMFNLNSNQIELTERDAPILIRSLDLIIDSVGPGKFRSGYTNSLVLESLGDTVFVTVLLDSGRFLRPMRYGGGVGMTSYLFQVRKASDDPHIDQRNGVIPSIYLDPLAGRFNDQGQIDPEHGEWCQGTRFTTLKLNAFHLTRGSALYIICAPGGGYGSPLDRDPAMVRADVWNERTSVAFAEQAYGVVINPSTLAVDEIKTAELRARLKEMERQNAWTPPVGAPNPWPKDWEHVMAL